MVRTLVGWKGPGGKCWCADREPCINCLSSSGSPFYSCNHFSDLTPDHLGLTFSGWTDGCSCHNTTYYLPYMGCDLWYWGQDSYGEYIYQGGCKWSADSECEEIGFGCFGNGDDSIFADCMELYLQCYSRGVRFNLRVPDWGDGLDDRFSFAYSSGVIIPPLAGAFPPITLYKNPTAPANAPATCTVSGADGSPTSVLPDTTFQGLCDGCGAVADQYRLDISGISPLFDFIQPPVYYHPYFGQRCSGGAVDPNGTIIVEKLGGHCSGNHYWGYTYCSRGGACRCAAVLTIVGPPEETIVYVDIDDSCWSPNAPWARFEARVPSPMNCSSLSNLTVPYGTGTDWSGAASGVVLLSAI